MRKSLITASLLMGFLAPAAQADFVNVWSYEVASSWDTAETVFSSGTGSQVNTATELSWGGSGSERSSLKITNTPQSGFITTGVLIPQPTNHFIHSNNPIGGAYATLLQAVLTTSLTLTPFDPIGGQLPAKIIDFTVNFSETPNTAGTCVAGAASVCDDIFVISNGAVNNEFDYDGYHYYASIVQIIEGALKPLIPLGNDACQEAGAQIGCLGFITPENQSTEIAFGILITAERLQIELPEPGILGLMGLGLLGLLASRRRKTA